VQEKKPLHDIKPKQTYNWRTYLAEDLERPAKIAAIQNGKNLSEYLSEIVRNNLPEVKIIQ
jgi:hypothetical protein